jgi:hypothetical protein
LIESGSNIVGAAMGEIVMAEMIFEDAEIERDSN